MSRDHAEPLAATASHVEHWILLEYRRLWSRDIVAGSGLPEEAKAHLRAQLASLPRSRLLFIRRPERRGDEPIALFFGRAGESAEPFRALELAGYDEVASHDVAGVLRGGAPVGEPVSHPLLVVCTHGKRDRCCAKFGRPLYEELREEADADWVWQSTHVGGDRFAGNLVCFPEGLYFGRVERPDVWSLLDEYLARRIELEHYRGRSCYPFPVQAAERRVREETGLVGIDDLRLELARRTGEAAWSARFLASSGGRHEVEVASELAADPTYLTCSSPRLERPRRYVATAYRAHPD